MATQSNGKWLNSRGNPTDPAKIDPVTKRKDRTVESVVKDAIRLQRRMELAKLNYLDKIEKYQTSAHIFLNHTYHKP